MDGYQLWYALNSNPVTDTHFDGIFAPDTLHKINYRPTLLICNTDPSYKKGTHWLAFYFDNKGKAEMFDSLGKQLTDYATDIEQFVAQFSNVCKTLIKRVQPLQTSLCGHYCLYYAYCKSLGHSMEFIVNNMPSSDKIESSVCELYNLIPSQFHPCTYQCCTNC